jgi:hypothetical protein
MTPTTYRRLWIGLLLAGVLSTGCNPLTTAFYMAHIMGMEHNVQPEFPLTSADTEKDKEVKVVILSYSSLETRPEFLRVDYELAGIIAKRVQDQAKKNKEKITVVPPSKVQKFKDDHPNWKALGAEEVGKHFEADYVIDLAIEQISLYEPGSRNTIFRGHANISLAVIDLAKPDEDPQRKEYTCEYPPSRPIPVDPGSTSVAQFRLAFLNHVGTDIAWMFVAHPLDEDFHRID